MNTNIGEKIKFYRKEKQITQKQLGEKIGVTASTITKYENGTLTPPIQTLIDISNTLGITLNSLLPSAQTNYENMISEVRLFLNKNKNLINPSYLLKEEFNKWLTGEIIDTFDYDALAEIIDIDLGFFLTLIKKYNNVFERECVDNGYDLYYLLEDKLKNFNIDINTLIDIPKPKVNAYTPSPNLTTIFNNEEITKLKETLSKKDFIIDNLNKTIEQQNRQIASLESMLKSSSDILHIIQNKIKIEMSEKHGNKEE